MPPTMILTVPPCLPPPPPEEVRESRQAARDRAVVAASAAAAIRGGGRIESSPRLRTDADPRRGVPRAGDGGSDLRVVAGGRRPPAQQATLEEGEEPLGEQRDHRDDDHSGVDAGRVERALGVVDEEAEAL